MYDLEELHKSGELITAKQYKRYIVLYVCISIIFGLLVIGGLIFVMIAWNKIIFIMGTIIALIGIVLLLIASYVFIVEYGKKLWFYRQFKKHPEDYIVIEKKDAQQ